MDCFASLLIMRTYHPYLILPRFAISFITAVTIHRSFSLPLQVQNSPFPPVFSSIVLLLFHPPDWLNARSPAVYIYGHFGSKTFRQQDTSAAEEYCRSVRTLRQHCRCVLRTLRQCRRSVSWCGPYVYSPSFGISDFRWFKFKSIHRFRIVFIAFLVLINYLFLSVIIKV